MKKISVPVLTIHGTYDRNAPYEGGKQWATTLPNVVPCTLSTVTVAPTLAHFLKSPGHSITLPLRRASRVGFRVAESLRTRRLHMRDR